MSDPIERIPTGDDQLVEDLKVVKRVDGYAKGLNEREATFVESCLERLEGDRRPLTDAQRKWIHDLDDRKVG